MLTNEEKKQLCLDLIKADSEKEIEEVLARHPFTKEDYNWRYFGDYENNYNTIGNQQSRPEAALVEKLVNAVDARLMSECLIRSIDPEGPAAPKTIKDAIAMFFEDVQSSGNVMTGRIEDWTSQKRTEVAQGITLAATGPRSSPSYTISDSGEGQTPNGMPGTLLSLNKSNKLRISFVQGKFNMGGTGVLKFCGKNNYQLIVSRRNPAIPKSSSEKSDHCWGFTLVRREEPKQNRKSSVYTYLAPEGAKNGTLGGVLFFECEKMPIFPDQNISYTRESAWGTLIKLYEYSSPGFKSHILMKDGLLRKADLLLPDLALPMRFYECRDYSGHPGSFVTNLTGIRVRLSDDKEKEEDKRTLEPGFPSTGIMKASGEEMTMTIYAFQKGKSDVYKKGEGIVFIVNGQTHGILSEDFFKRKKVGLSYLADSLLVLVDCSSLSARAREDLFMNSRDRLSGGELRNEIEDEIERILKEDSKLKSLKEERRRQEIGQNLEESKPLEDILKDLINKSPALSSLFLPGKRLPNPLKSALVGSIDVPFVGKRFPTYFHFKKFPPGKNLEKDCHINFRARIQFETDAENEYFKRNQDPGEFLLYILTGAQYVEVGSYSLHLQSGEASLNVRLPNEAKVGDVLEYKAVIKDVSRVDSIENFFKVKVHPEAKSSGGSGGKSSKPPSDKNGTEKSIPTGFQLPNVAEVFESDWASKNPPFEKTTALRVKNTGEASEDDDDQIETYDFMVNMDNIYLKTELKNSKVNPEVLKSQFKFGIVLFGLSIILDNTGKKNSSENEEGEKGSNSEDIEKKVEKLSAAFAPFLLPMIQFLGGLEPED